MPGELPRLPLPGGGAALPAWAVLGIEAWRFLESKEASLPITAAGLRSASSCDEKGVQPAQAKETARMGPACGPSLWAWPKGPALDGNHECLTHSS